MLKKFLRTEIQNVDDKVIVKTVAFVAEICLPIYNVPQEPDVHW